MADTHHELPEGYEVEPKAEGLVNLKATCCGCGEEVFDQIVFEDVLDDISGQPIHDSATCLKEAKADV
jgi:hypothetical protein